MGSSPIVASVTHKKPCKAWASHPSPPRTRLEWRHRKTCAMSPSLRTRFAAVFRAFLAAALCLSLLPAGPGVRRADATVSTLDIYTDALAAGWDNWSWATVDLQSTAYAHSGSDSI